MGLIRRLPNLGLVAVLVAELLAVAAVVVGVALIYAPAALIVGGVATAVLIEFQG